MHAALGPVEHVAHDLEPVPVLVGKSQKHLKEKRFQDRGFISR
jgi:hypothetical protein